jgi:hypothetical protein
MKMTDQIGQSGTREVLRTSAGTPTVPKGVSWVSSDPSGEFLHVNKKLGQDFHIPSNSPSSNHSTLYNLNYALIKLQMNEAK